MSDEILYRAFEPDLEIKTRAKGGDGRTVIGIAVPWGKPVRVDSRLVEQFANGAFNDQLRAAPRIPFAREHIKLGGTLIGRSLMYRNDASGLYGEWRVSPTPAGDETLTLIEDGALDQLSVGFRERQNRRLTGGIMERIKAELREVAVTLEGAYGELAAVAGVRSAVDDTTSNLDRARQILASLPTLPPAV
jgi:HK97 family phage prohead protease